LTVPPFNNTTPTATFPLSVQFHKIVLQINRPNYHDKKKKKKAGRSSSFKLFLHDGMEQWTRVGAYNPRYMSLDRGARSQQKKSNHSKPDTNKRAITLLPTTDGGQQEEMERMRCIIIRRPSSHRKNRKYYTEMSHLCTTLTNISLQNEYKKSSL
jgi:hypothetical protein